MFQFSCRRSIEKRVLTLRKREVFKVRGNFKQAQKENMEGRDMI